MNTTERQQSMISEIEKAMASNSMANPAIPLASIPSNIDFAEMINKAIYKANKPGTTESQSRRSNYTLQEMERIADMIFTSGEYPQSVNRREQLVTRMIAGQDVGLSPMQSIAGIMIVNGSAKIYGDVGMMLVLRSPFYYSHREWIEDDGKNGKVAKCEYTRIKYPHLLNLTIPKNESKNHNIFVTVERSFSWAQAMKAGLPTKGKNPAESNWNKFPERMLTFRARWLAIRDLFADVLAGMSSVEEAEDWAELRGQLVNSVQIPVQESTSNPQSPTAEQPATAITHADQQPVRVDQGSNPEKGFHFTDVLNPNYKPDFTPVADDVLAGIATHYKTWAESQGKKHGLDGKAANAKWRTILDDFYQVDSVKKLSQPQGLELLNEMAEALKKDEEIFRRHRT